MTMDLEARIRETLTAKAETVTHADLPPRSLDEARSSAGNDRAARRPFAIAAALLAVVAIGAAAVLARNEGGPSGRTPTAAEPLVPATGSDGRAWPLTNDEPLTGSIGGLDLSTPDAAARAYTTAVIGLPSDWSLDPPEVAGDQAAVRFVLQDVPGAIHLARDTQGLWFVTSATTELVSPGVIPVSDGVHLSLGPGPRTYDSGVDVRATAFAADGRTLAQVPSRVLPVQGGAGAAAAIVALGWAGPELAAAVQVDAYDDHDDNPRTPDAKIGHWTAALAVPRADRMPVGADLEPVQPLFAGPGAPAAVATAYMKDRFPDYPAPGIKVGRLATRGARATVEWGSIDGIVGRIFLRQTGGQWGVMAVTTDGVDLSELRVSDGRLQGQITSTNINSLAADVLRRDGNPVAGAPKPDGMPGAAYRFATAAGPATGALAVDVALDGASPILRVHLVGGTLLSISEVALAV